MGKAEHYEQLASELCFIREKRLKCDWDDMLPYCLTTLVRKVDDYSPTDDDNFIYDVLLKILMRGQKPFLSYNAEKIIINNYGLPFSLKEETQNRSGSIKYDFDKDLELSYKEFFDLIEPWHGTIDEVDFDPDNPKNEKELFSRIIQKFGNILPHCIDTQVNIENIVDDRDKKSFIGQRADILLSFPNGKHILLEPGDHDDDSRQVALDKSRDKAFDKVGIRTIRPRNIEIYENALYDQIKEVFLGLDVVKYIKNMHQKRSEKQLAENYLFLLPSLITRVERLLLYFWFKCGLAHKNSLRIGFIERDLECAEIAMYSFLDQLKRLYELYGIKDSFPEINLYVKRNPEYHYDLNEEFDFPVQDCETFEGLPLDLILDVSIKCNHLTTPELSGADYAGSVRQTFKHRSPVHFGYLSKIKAINMNNDMLENTLNSYIQDFFRKYKMREGQKDIITNILNQKATIGLLPTSAGKSICYQLSSILTPGITVIVDPIVALMNDQVQGLEEQFGINKVFPLHAGSNVRDYEIGRLLSENIMIFISPERLQRPSFRSALKSMNAADIFVNYAVIDEAHCVSMWGHDFRPSYLMLERNFKQYFSFQGNSPVVVALTGTASQLVLIDLKRELNIQDLEAIIRPKTFDRDELNFSLVKCSANDKKKTLGVVMNAIARRLNVQQVTTEACGIVFAYTPKELWELFGEQVANSKEYVRTVLRGNNNLSYGFYSGSQPQKLGISSDEWNKYKEATLKAFKRGDIRLLFGNTAVGVGIDNEDINYIINYKMPQSFEAYYQQCGRAGRAKQRSECYLIFSDDKPEITKQWLNRELQKMPNRWDDLGIVSYFHEGNFPGQDVDIDAASEIFVLLFKEQADEKGKVFIKKYYKPDIDKTKAERTERYLSYLLILGVIEDYEVTGSDDKSTTYNVAVHQVVKDFLQNRDEDKLKQHLLENIHKYMTRYRPLQIKDIEADINSRQEKMLSKRCIGYLVDFIYTQIEYQRREAIRDMVGLCNTDNPTPEKLRDIIKKYFDSSEKFSQPLLGMTEIEKPDFSKVKTLLDNIDGYDDVEHLYWETRRLLSERHRVDWYAASLFAQIYRARGLVPDNYSYQIDTIVNSFAEIHKMTPEDEFSFLADFLSYLSILDDTFGETVSEKLQLETIAYLFSYYGLPYTRVIDMMNISDNSRNLIRLKITNLQLKEIIDERYTRVIG